MASDRTGPIGEYPLGKLRVDDMGALRVAVGVQHGNVVIEFGARLTWIGMPPEQAEQLAATLVRKAHEARANRS